MENFRWILAKKLAKITMTLAKFLGYFLTASNLIIIVFLSILKEKTKIQEYMDCLITETMASLDNIYLTRIPPSYAILGFKKYEVICSIRYDDSLNALIAENNIDCCLFYSIPIFNANFYPINSGSKLIIIPKSKKDINYLRLIQDNYSFNVF